METASRESTASQWRDAGNIHPDSCPTLACTSWPGDPVVERKMDGALIPSALLRAVRRPALDLGFRIDTLLRRGERCCMVASNACASSPRLR